MSFTTARRLEAEATDVIAVSWRTEEGTNVEASTVLRAPAVASWRGLGLCLFYRFVSVGVVVHLLETADWRGKEQNGPRSPNGSLNSHLRND